MKAQQFLALALIIPLVAIISCGGGSPPSTINADSPNGQQLPFSENKPLVVPTNTILYVRLQQSITGATAQPGESFSAVLDEPLLVDGQTVVPQGAEVTGKVLMARATGRLHNAGYVRITLSAISVNGKTLPLQTTSMIAGGGTFKSRGLGFAGSGLASIHATGEKEAGFAAENRIGFRLTQPLSVS